MINSKNPGASTTEVIILIKKFNINKFFNYDYLVV